MTTPRLLLSFCALSATLAAQVNSPATITNGAATYTQSTLPVTEIPAVTDVIDGGGGDLLYQHWWWFRVAGDLREYTFKDDGTATRVVNGSLTGMVTSWADVDNRGLFSATLTQDLFPTGFQGAYLLETMTINNLTASQLDIEVFCYTDFDINGFSNDSARGHLSNQVIVDATSLTLSGEFSAVGNSAVEVGPYASIQGKLQNSTVDNLAGWNGTFGPADFTGAYQWSLQVPANSSTSVLSELVSLTCRPTVVNYGATGAGTPGVPTITSDFGVLRQNASVTNVRLGNGLPNSLSALLLNINSANTVLFGLQINVDPNGVSTLFTPTSVTGDATYALTFPPSNPAFCGIDFFFQGLIADPGGVAGLAATTQGVQMRLGAR